MLVRLPSSQYSVNPNCPHIIKVNLTSLALQKLHKPNWVNRVYAIPKSREILGALRKMLSPLTWGEGPTHGSHNGAHLSCERREHCSQSMKEFPQIENFYYTCGTQRRNWVVYIVFSFCFSDMGLVGNERKFGFWKLIIIGF